MELIKAAQLFASADVIGQSFWSNSVTSTYQDIASDTSCVTPGIRLSSDVAGAINGARFVKGLNNKKQHIGTFWSGTGTKLAEVAFSGETSSVRQQAPGVYP
jgi:hypothetical protein